MFTRFWVQQPGLNNPRSRSIPIVSTCFNPVKDFEAGTLCQSTPTYPTIAPCLLKVCHSSRDVVETAGSFQPWSVGKGTRDFRILVKNLFQRAERITAGGLSEKKLFSNAHVLLPLTMYTNLFTACKPKDLSSVSSVQNTGHFT